MNAAFWGRVFFFFFHGGQERAILVVVSSPRLVLSLFPNLFPSSSLLWTAFFDAVFVTWNVVQVPRERLVE